MRLFPVIIVIWLVSSYSPQKSFGSGRYDSFRIIPISDTVSENDCVELILSLPSKDETVKTWSFFLGTLFPVATGDLGSSPQFELAKMKGPGTGNFNAVLVLHDDKNDPVLVSTSLVNVVAKKKDLDWKGYAITSTFSVLVVLISITIRQKYSERIARKRFERALKSKIEDMTRVKHRNDRIDFDQCLKDSADDHFLREQRNQRELQALRKLAHEWDESVIGMSEYEKKLYGNKIVREMGLRPEDNQL